MEPTPPPALNRREKKRRHVALSLATSSNAELVIAIGWSTLFALVLLVRALLAKPEHDGASFSSSPSSSVDALNARFDSAIAAFDARADELAEWIAAASSSSSSSPRVAFPSEPPNKIHPP